MARFVFIVPPFIGHINPTLALGQALMQHGHTVAWICVEETNEHIFPANGLVLKIRYQTPAANKLQLIDSIKKIADKPVHGLESIQHLYDEILLPLNRYMYDGIIKNLLTYKADVIITDHQMFAGAIAATQLNIPYATSVTAPASLKAVADLPKLAEWESGKIIALQHRYGLHPKTPLNCSLLLTLIYTSKLFFGETILPPNYKFVGPLIAERPDTTTFNWHELGVAKNQFCIYITIGTTFNHADKLAFFNKVAAAFKDSFYTVFVASKKDLLAAWPVNFMVAPHWPQLKLLRYVNAVVCHGGQNTVSETLMEGLPLVVLPIAYDQSAVATQVVNAGVGIRLHFNRFKAMQLKNAVDEICTNSSYAVEAKKIKQSFAEAGGVATAVTLLQNLMDKKSK